MNTQKLRWKKRKYFIRINCGIMIALLVAILLLMGFPIVSDADSPTYLSDVIPDLQYHIIDQVGYLSSESYDSSATMYSSILINESRLNADLLDGDTSNGEYTIELNGINPSDYPYKYIVADSSNYLFLYFAKVNVSDVNLYGGYVIINSYRYGIFSQPPYDLPSGISSSSITDYVQFRLRYSSSTNFEYFSSGNYNSTHPYYSHVFGVEQFGFNYANFPLYDLHSVTVPNNNMLIENIEGYPDVNYLINYSPDPVTYPDGSGGEIINNMYMRTADWKFNVPQYWTNTNFVNSNPTDKWGSGNVQFYGLVNDFQKANVSDYNLKFDYYLQLVGSYDGGVSFAHSYALRGVNYPLSDFLNNNNTYQVGIDYIFTNATDINANNIYNTLEDLRGGQISQVNFSKWELSCSAHLESGNYTSGSIQETYSFLSQISKEVNNTITENNNPYYPPGYDDTSSSNNNSVVTSKDGQIVLTNYDNDSLVIDNGHDEVINTLYDKLVPDNVTGESGLTQRFVSLTNANQWFNVMTASLSIFPQEFWTTIYTIFLASLGVIGTAFLLWIVVHIL